MAAPLRLAFAASDRPEAEAARRSLVERYGDAPRAQADVIVALGGDGFMLETLRDALGNGTPIFGMNRGSVGFLMNDFNEDGLLERIAQASPTVIHPLGMRAVTVSGEDLDALFDAWLFTGSKPEVGLGGAGRAAARPGDAGAAAMAKRLVGRVSAWEHPR